MIFERKRGPGTTASDAPDARRVTAVLGLLALAACGAPAVEEPYSNTGPQATVARVVIETSKVAVSAAAQDSIVFRGRAYDNVGDTLALQLQWRSDPASVFGIDPAKGRGAGVSPGTAIVWATAGTTHSNSITVTVRP